MPECFQTTSLQLCNLMFAAPLEHMIKRYFTFFTRIQLLPTIYAIAKPSLTLQYSTANVCAAALSTVVTAGSKAQGGIDHGHRCRLHPAQALHSRGASPQAGYASWGTCALMDRPASCSLFKFAEVHLQSDMCCMWSLLKAQGLQRPKA